MVTQPKANPKPKTDSSKRVLVVEDNPADVMLIREALIRSGTSVRLEIATDAEEALRLFRTTAFDLVILDLNIPKAEVHPVLQQCRFQDCPPVIVFSGSQNPSERENALSLGATDYIVKPHSLDVFIGAVQDIFERHT